MTAGRLAALLAAAAAAASPPPPRELPSVDVGDVGAAELERVRGRCAAESWYLEISGRLYCPVGAKKPSAHQLRDPVAAHYRVVNGRDLPAELRRHRVGGDGDTHVLYRPDEEPAELERMTEAAREKGGDRSFGGELISLERTKNTVLKGSWRPAKGAATALSDAELAFAKPIVAEVSADRLEKGLRGLTEIPSRYVGSDSFPQAFAYVRQQLADAGVTIDDAQSPALTDAERRGDGDGPVDAERGSSGCAVGDMRCWGTRNVIGKIEGSDPNLAPMLVGAHFDCLPSHGRAPGAEDNGSGVAVMLEMARVLGASKPERSVVFAGWAGEEQGMTGSEHWARTHLEEGGGKIDGAIIMDEVGWSRKGHTEDGVQLETYDRPDTAPMVDLLGRSFRSIAGPTTRVDVSHSPYGSDHMSLLRHPTKAPGTVLVINADDRDYPHYHQSSDSIDSADAIDFGLLSSVARSHVAAAALWANPSWATAKATPAKAKKAPTGHALEAAGTDLANELARIEGQLEAMAKRRRA